MNFPVKAEKSEFLKKDILTSNTCVEPTAHFFIQYSCTVLNEQLEKKYNKVSVATSCILLIAFCFVNLIYFMQTTSKLDQLDYDIKTITAGDYTVQMDITKSMWGFFIDEIYPNRYEDKFSPALAFKKYLIEEI